MADVLGTVTTVLHLINKTYELYTTIKNCPPQINRIGRRVQRVQSMLQRVEIFLLSDPGQTIAKTGGGVVLLAIVDDVREDTEAVTILLDKWRSASKLIGQAWFVIGGHQDDLVALGDEMEKSRAELRGELVLMGGQFGLDQVQDVPAAAGLVDQEQEQEEKDFEGGGGGKGSSSPPQTSQLVQQPSPPLTPRAEYNIIFIDPDNQGRSIVAEAYTKLVGEWTVGTGGAWRINLVHSAGFFVRNRSGVLDVTDNMPYLYPSYKLPNVPGHAPPSATALAALFDNELFNYRYKSAVRAHMEARRSRGIARSVFGTYDLLVVFTHREYDNLMRLRKELVARAQGGRRAVTGGGGKGRVVLLGGYGPRKQGLAHWPKEILAPKGKDADSRDSWNGKVGEIKMAVNGLLRREFGWAQPRKLGS